MERGLDACDVALRYLVSDLVSGHVKVTGSYVEQVVLDQVHCRGNHHLGD